MAKNNNLTDFLTDVANAIREKKGTTDLINPQDFSSEIASIETGGGGGGEAIEEKDINFYDYDGTLLYSYTKNEALALNELPPLPQRAGLICQEWNWSLEGIKNMASTQGVCDIGANYITDDGKTRLYLTLYEGRLSPIFKFYIYNPNGVDVVVEWGDGETSTYWSTANIETQHIYSSAGDYVVSIYVPEGCELQFGGDNTKSIMGSGDRYNKHYQKSLTKVEIGERTYLYPYAFYQCGIKHISIPSTNRLRQDYIFYYSDIRFFVFPKVNTYIDEYCFSYAGFLEGISINEGIRTLYQYAFQGTSIKRLVFPYTFNRFNGSAFSNLPKLETVSLSPNITFIGDQNFRELAVIEKITLPNSVTYIGDTIFYSCPNLRSVTLPENEDLTSLSGNSVSSCTSLTKLFIPKNIIELGDSGSFCALCYALAICDFSTHEQVPTLSGSSSFQKCQSDLKIIVPDTLYDEWIASTNWSSFASYIVKASDYYD